MGDATVSSPSTVLDRASQCTICHAQPSKYTCPGCRTNTCSADCSNAHKATMVCSGVRDRAAYIPMNAYGWGTMMDDYVFLEDIGRLVESHGASIMRGGISTRTARGMGRGGPSGIAKGLSGPGRAANGRQSYTSSQYPKSKREILKMQLGFKGIRMDLMADGMQRQRTNQSRFDSRDNSIQLTCDFVLYAPSEWLRDQIDFFQITLHHISTATSIRDVLLSYLRKAFSDEGKTTKSIKSSEQKRPSWLQWYLHALADSQSGTPLEQAYIPLEMGSDVEEDEQNDDRHNDVETKVGPKDEKEEGNPRSVPDPIRASAFRVLLPEYPPRPIRRDTTILSALSSVTGVHSQRPVPKPHHLIHPISESLLVSLRGKGFLEFPTFVLIPSSNEEANERVILVEDVPKSGVIAPTPPNKRRRVGVANSMTVNATPSSVNAKALANILDAYASEDNEGSDKGESVKSAARGIIALGGYESDEPQSSFPSDQEDEDGDGEAPESIMASNALSFPSRWLADNEKEDEIDWGEDEIIE